MARFNLTICGDPIARQKGLGRVIGLLEVMGQSMLCGWGESAE